MFRGRRFCTTDRTPRCKRHKIIRNEAGHGRAGGRRKGGRCKKAPTENEEGTQNTGMSASALKHIPGHVGQQQQLRGFHTKAKTHQACERHLLVRTLTAVGVPVYPSQARLARFSKQKTGVEGGGYPLEHASGLSFYYSTSEVQYGSIHLVERVI